MSAPGETSGPEVSLTNGRLSGDAYYMFTFVMDPMGNSFSSNLVPQFTANSGAATNETGLVQGPEYTRNADGTITGRAWYYIRKVPNVTRIDCTIDWSRLNIFEGSPLPKTVDTAVFEGLNIENQESMVSISWGAATKEGYLQDLDTVESGMSSLYASFKFDCRGVGLITPETVITINGINIEVAGMAGMHLDQAGEPYYAYRVSFGRINTKPMATETFLYLLALLCLIRRSR